ncbi:NIPSNAP family protein [Roseococcus microcysteis]|uniref:NIPSNAP family protein n=1 Tax=Roseococcus microcysteis TaxID=2771361 RepID=UPI00168BCBE1|nr:NIPSNAP family protein [Roseococcus microcysteis]
MLVDIRIYTAAPGKLPAFVKLYEEKAWPLQKKYLENCLGWYATAEGELNTVVHIWGYKDMADRDARRNAMAADPEWGTYLKAMAEAGVLVKMENRLARPTGFFAEFQAAKKG